MKHCRHRPILHPILIVAAAIGIADSLTAQSQPAAGSAPDSQMNESLGELKSQVRELKQLVLQLEQQTNDSRAEIVRLRQELQASRPASPGARLAVGADEESEAHAGVAGPQPDERMNRLEENEQLLAGKIDEQYQTKLESASKYRVRFSGIVLFNLFSNSGSVDNLDVPGWAREPGPGNSSGALGGTLRQSILGFEVFGPMFMGARTSGNVNFDFGGGFPTVDNGVTFGLARLRTAAFHLDWKNTSLIAGQDQLFISPDSPTSFASLIIPPLAYAGNLWTWTPQVRVEHRLPQSNNSAVTLQAALLDPLTGEPPVFQWYRVPQAGERSRAPAVAGRVAYTHPLFGHPLTIGASGYYSRQNWGFNRDVNAWAGMTDWNLPLAAKFSLSGLFYRGAAIGGLGAAVGRSVLYNGDLENPTTSVIPINTVGGWAQLKFRPGPRIEFNAAFGMDNPFAADLRAFGGNAQTYGDPNLSRNLGGFGNVIYHPRSDLLFSLEYRRLRTFNINDAGYQAGQLNLGMGVLF